MYSLKQKLEVINYINENDASLCQAQNKFNISRETIRVWIGKYRNGGDNALKTSHKKRKYSGKFKLDVVEYMYEHRFSHKKTSIIFGINDYLVKEWDLVYKYEGKDVLLKGNYMKTTKKKNQDLNSKSKEELLEEIEQLRMENAYLKKLRALVLKKTKPNNGKK